jgi:hypothetical protein
MFPEEREMKPILALLVFGLTASIASAGHTSKTFGSSCDAVWAAEQTVLASGQYKTVVLDKEKRTASFADNSVVTLLTSLSGSGDTCTMTLEGGLWRSFHKNSENFLNHVGNVLAAPK